MLTGSQSAARSGHGFARAAVVGAGLMGRGIAGVLAAGGLDVVLCDIWREAIALVADGICDAATADLVARNTIGLRLARMGPIENADYVGLDLTLAIHDAVFPSLSTDGTPSQALRALVRRGDLGAKTGQGFLPWVAGSRETAARELAAHVRAQEPSRAARCCDTARGQPTTSSQPTINSQPAGNPAAGDERGTLA